MANKRRFCTAVLAVLILLAVTASLVILAHESNHDCIGEDCMVCAVVAVCRNTLKSIFETLAALAVTAASVCFTVNLITALKIDFQNESPVSLKVKLLN